MIKQLYIGVSQINYLPQPLATDKSRYFAQPCPIIADYLVVEHRIIKPTCLTSILIVSCYVQNNTNFVQILTTSISYKIIAKKE